MLMVTAVLYFRELVRCRLVERANRFTVIADADGLGRVRVHNTNTGKLVDVLVEGREAYCTPLSRPVKTRLRLLAVEYGNGYALVDTQSQEKAFISALKRGLIRWLRGCSIIRRHVKVENSRLDLLLTCHGGQQAFIELKSAILASSDGGALYPDTPSPRGRRHIEELAQLARQGYRAYLVFIAAFPGARYFMPNCGVDPLLQDLLDKAVASGVVVRAIGLDFEPGKGVARLYNDELPVKRCTVKGIDRG